VLEHRPDPDLFEDPNDDWWFRHNAMQKVRARCWTPIGPAA
jgi:hypothetical protein